MIKKTITFLLVFLMLLVLAVLWISHQQTSSHKPSATKQLTSIYSKQANLICKQLNQAQAHYEQGHAKKAHQLAEDAYWNIYDNILEIKYRSYATPATIFSVEQSFHQLSDLFEKPYSAEQIIMIKQSVTSICKNMHQQAKLLNHSETNHD